MKGYVNQSKYDDYEKGLDRPIRVYIECDCGHSRWDFPIATKEERKTLPYRLIVTCTQCFAVDKFAIVYDEYLPGRQYKLRNI